MLMDQNTQWLYQLLAEVQLEKYYIRVRDGLNITRVEHFNYVKESDLEQIGISKPAQRRLYDALKRYKTASRSRQWFPKGFSRVPDGGEQAAAASVQSPDVAVRPTAQLIDDGDLSLGDKLGSGSFGVVRKGEWHSPSGIVITVAVKLLRGGMSRQTETLKDFLQEVTTMQSLDHPHIIRLYGVVLTHPFKMVTELASHGSLYDKLRARQYKYPLLRLWLFATQIADGMDYLESRRFLHRDLAARNVLLSSKEGVKIGDFGLMRGLSQEKDHYIMGAHKRIPFAWCAPESLRVGSFSHASDVWMFGITMWEMFTYCEEPWFGLSGREILSRVEQDGERLDKPPDCPQELYGVMRKCWALNPAERPHFAEFITILKETKPTQVQVLREFSEPRKLPLAPNDIVTLIDHGLEMSEWRGQNQRTLDIGWFPPGLTVPPTTSTSMGSNLHPAGLYISPPMMGSLQHRGHGDIHSDRSWGSPERLDDTASWRTVLGRENGGSNLQKMAGLSQSLESVLSGQRPPDQSTGPMRMNQQGRLMPPAMNAPSMVTQKDPRRFSEAGPVGPPRPPPPNMRRLYVKPQRKPIVQPPMGNPWPSQMVPAQPRTQGPPQQGMQGSNLLKMAPFSRSTPQLDDERGQNTKDNLIALVMEAVHGVTTEDVQRALQSNEWNPTRAEQQLKLDQLYFLSLCSAEDCVKILQKHKWDLQEASKYLIRLTREERACAGEGLRPQISAERRV